MESASLRILVVISALPRGGAERVVSTLTHEWSRNHDVMVAVFDGELASYECGGRIVDLRLHAIGPVWKRAYTAIWQRSTHLARLFRRENPDRIVAFMESANLPAIIAGAMTGLLSRLRVSVRTNPSAIPRRWRWLIPSLYRVPECVVAPSIGVKKRLESMGIPTKRVLVIPNPVAPQAVAPSGVPSPFSHSYVLGVGRLHPAKGFDRLVTAFADVHQNNLHLIVLGEGDDRLRLACLARASGVESRVHFPGLVPDVGPWYRHAHCFVLSSRYEGRPNALVEAMANGCASISFDCQYGPNEILEDGKSGLLVAQDDIEALTAAITRVVSDNALRQRLGAEGRRRVARFSVERIAPLWYAE